jgi:hypothetical protein
LSLTATGLLGRREAKLNTPIIAASVNPRKAMRIKSSTATAIAFGYFHYLSRAHIEARSERIRRKLTIHVSGEETIQRCTFRGSIIGKTGKKVFISYSHTRCLITRRTSSSFKGLGPCKRSPHSRRLCKFCT